jgi:serine phosphatase RsbU (regulator of sigma subunit)
MRLRDLLPYLEVGTQLPEDLGVDEPFPVDLIRRVLDDGDPVMDREARCVSADRIGERTYSTFLFRVEGVDSRPLGVCLLAIDITHSRARERLALLREASVKIGTTLDVKQTAQELADLTVRSFADYVTVDLTDNVLPGAEPLQRLQPTGSGIPVFRRAGLASIHHGIPESLWAQGQPVFVPPSSPYTEVLDTGRSYLQPVLDPSRERWLDEDHDRARLIRATGMHTLIIVPLKARGNLLGIAVFVRTDNKTPFSRDDVVLAEELAARASLSLDNARQYTREHNAALALQRQLLPRKMYGGDAVELASRYVPSDVYEGVGGDWYDTILLPDSRVALIVGDVTGHGIHAAASMGRLRTAMRTLAHLDLPPDQLLSRLDEVYAREADEDDGPSESPIAATCLYAVYDPATRVCTMASAGHPPPAVATPAGEVTFPSFPTGTPIGLAMAPHTSFEMELDAGTLLAFYTDGLIERREYGLTEGMSRLSAALTQSVGSLDVLSSTLIETLITDGVEDDVTLLLARTRHPNR